MIETFSALLEKSQQAERLEIECMVAPHVLRALRECAMVLDVVRINLGLTGLPNERDLRDLHTMAATALDGLRGAL